MFWLLLLVTAVSVVIYVRWQRRGFHKIYKEMPTGLPRYPIVGHGYMFRGTDEDRMNALQHLGRVALQQGGYSSFWLGHKLYAVIAEPESIQLVAKACLEKDDATMKYIRAVLGDGLIFTSVKIWRPRRKIMAPTFNMRNLQQFVQIFDKQSAIMADLLRERDGKGDFSIWKYITTYTFDSICEATLSVAINSQKQPDHPFIIAFDVLSRIVAQRMLSPWLYWDWAFNLTPLHKIFSEHKQIIHNFFDELIRAKRRELEGRGCDKGNSKAGPKSFLELMIESSEEAKGYSDIELREEVMAIVMAGTDTSAVGTAFTTVMLSRYPDVQEKVYQEMRDVFGDSDRPVTWEDLPKLEYLELVIKETLRLYPPAPVIVRDVHESVVLPSGSTLVPGTALMLHLWATHRNTKYWGADAEQFRPERFLDTPLRHPAQFVPFSYSLRNCIGSNYAMMSTKTNVTNLLRRYRVLPPANLDPSKLKEPLRVKFDVMMKHEDNFEVRLQRRINTSFIMKNYNYIDAIPHNCNNYKHI